MTGNELGLHLGERVLVKAIAMVGYWDKPTGVRDVKKFPCDPPIEMFIVGSVKKAIGKYIRGSGHRYFGEDYDPPSLKVEKYIWLYEAKYRFRDLATKSVLVLPEDILETAEKTNA